MKRLKAFTLIELLIGMILSAIIISFAYSCYSILAKEFLSYKDVKKQINETITLNSILNNDFVNSEFIYYKDDVLTIEKKGSKQEYSFLENTILRTDGEVTDTFHFSASKINIGYLKESDHSAQILVNDFSFVAKVLDENESFYFTKNYSAETALKLFIPSN